MCAATVDDLHQWVEKMMKSMSISDYKLDIAGNTTKGDGYLGEVTFLKVETKRNGSRKSYDLVVKSAKKSEELRKQTPIKEAYDRETYFYTKIFPALDQFQRDRDVSKPFTKVPKCYCVSEETCKEAVILQNLKTIGFELHDRKKAMNLNHVLMVFQNYGRFHALSLALRQQKPSFFKNLTKDLNDLFGLFIEQMNLMELFYKQFEHVKELLEKSGKSEALKKYDGFEKEFERILVNFSNSDTKPSAILHGDCWNNNFMFKYDGNDKTKPIDMCFLDFQIVKVGSPIIDLSYFLYCCGDCQIFKDFDFILQAYHSSLTDFLSELGCDPETFSYKELKEQWKEYGKFGLVLALFILQISLCDANEAPDLMKGAENGEDFNETFKITMQNENLYNDRLKNLYLHFAEKFL